MKSTLVMLKILEHRYGILMSHLMRPCPPNSVALGVARLTRCIEYLRQRLMRQEAWR